MKNLLMAYLRDEDGQTSTEYILLLAVVAMIVFRFKDVASERLNGLTEGIFTKADGWVDQLE